MENATVEVAVMKINPVADDTFAPVVRLIKLINSRRKCAGLARIRLFQNRGNKWDAHQ